MVAIHGGNSFCPKISNGMLCIPDVLCKPLYLKGGISLTMTYLIWPFFFFFFWRGVGFHVLRKSNLLCHSRLHNMTEYGCVVWPRHGTIITALRYVTRIDLMQELLDILSYWLCIIRFRWRKKVESNIRRSNRTHYFVCLVYIYEAHLCEGKQCWLTFRAFYTTAWL